MSHVPRGKEYSAPLSEASVLRSGRDMPEFARDQADRKKVPIRTAINSSSKFGRAAMTCGSDPERPVNILQTPRKRVRWSETPQQGRPQIPMLGVSLLKCKKHLVMLVRQLAPRRKVQALL